MIFWGAVSPPPPIREAAEALVNYLGIPRGRNPQVSHPGSVTIPSQEVPLADETIPDFSGLSKRELLPLLLRDDLHIEITGDGWVRSQTPAPGTPLEADTVIRLELR